MFKYLFLSVAFGVTSFFAAPAFANEQVGATARDALVHVLAHEVGHAILREFDLPILGPEEPMADDFATVYVHRKFPDRAAQIVSARARQNMADGEAAGMFSEYFDDDQRAGRSICILYGLDPEKHSGLATEFGLDGEMAAECRDVAPEVGRSWRRILEGLEMPSDARVTEVGIDVEDADVFRALLESGFKDDAYRLLSGIDWHSRITLVLAQCDGSAWWSRNGRRIVICGQYVQKFAEQLSD